MLYLSFMTALSMLFSRKRMPSRDWQTEFNARLLKRFFLRAARKGPVWSRKVMDSLPIKTTALQRLSLEEVELNGVEAFKLTPTELDIDVQRIIVYIHGGGYVTGSAKSYIPLVARLVDQSKLTAYSLHYRLSPEYPFPIPQEDCCRAITKIIELHPQHQLVLIGDSAGAGLSLSAALHGGGTIRGSLAGLGLLSPWVEPTANSGTIISNEPNDMFTPEILANSYAAHMHKADLFDTRVNFVKADLGSLPPLLIQVAGGEVFYDQIMDFSKRAKAQGVTVETEVFEAQFHVFQALAHHFEESKAARASLVAFARGQS